MKPQRAISAVALAAILIRSAVANEYTISLHYEPGMGDAASAASFSAQRTPSYDPRDVRGVREVRLVGGRQGLFRPVTCGSSCSSASLWWEEHGILYQVQRRRSSSLGEQEQQGVIVQVANSAVLAGPR